MFLQVSAPNLIEGSSTFEELFGSVLINSLTDSPPAKGRYNSFMSTGAPPSHVGRGLRPVTHLLGGEKLVAQHRTMDWQKVMQT